MIYDSTDQENNHSTASIGGMIWSVGSCPCLHDWWLIIGEMGLMIRLATPGQPLPASFQVADL
jgi:hypothetical protein